MPNVSVACALGLVFASPLACAPARTPAQVYLEYRSVVLSAKTVEDLAPFMPQKVRDEMATAPAAAKEMTFGLRQDMEKMVVGQPEVIKEDVQGDESAVEIRAVIDYSGTNPHLGRKPARATIKLVRERDGWKVVNAPNWAME